ncbi:MAG: AhpC/TSA family protein [Symploca sp. SIO1B1]|nr:AhpC/TSA family protein [Symploca sp. SIO1C2]NER47245.1 AhpC/TSA family protein [Symploca sp. SIO1A3]NER93823.1 AhpC/TSA family protein [Symploca sp. SIO1B1]
MSLQQQLSKLKTNIKSKIPEDVLQKFDESIQALDESGMANHAPQVGDELNNFVLSNQLGQQRSLAELCKSGPVVMVFYRGGWCPYCNLELRGYQQILPQLKAAGAQLVAITPELPDSSLSTIEKNELEFEVLSDVGADYAKEIGLAFTLPEELREIYANLGGDLQKFNGAGNFNLPIPATLVVNTDGKIVFAHVDVDYTTRANPEEVLSVVRNNK